MKNSVGKIWVYKNDTLSTDQKYKDANKIEINIATDIHTRLLKRNRKHLNQAKNTPFAKGYLVDEICLNGENQGADDILNGTWRQTQVVEECVAQYIRELKYAAVGVENSVDTDISDAEYTSFWDKKRESTATSQFGLHVGHYKTGIQDEDILQVHKTLMLVPFIRGFAPKKWCKSIQLMLQEDPGRPWIHRLSIIELLDAYFNAALMIIFGRKWYTLQTTRT